MGERFEIFEWNALPGRGWRGPVETDLGIALEPDLTGQPCARRALIGTEFHILGDCRRRDLASDQMDHASPAGPCAATGGAYP